MRKFILLIVILSVIFAGRAEAGISFLKKTILLTEDGKESILTQKFYSEGEMLRIEEESSGIEGNPGVRIYDFKKGKLYTIMLDVKLYMEQDIGSEKEDVMFEPLPEKRYAGNTGIEVLRKELLKDTIQGHPATMYEVKVIRKVEKGKEKEEQVMDKYILWVAEDLDKMPIRYEFELASNGKKIIEYIDVKTETIAPSLFSVPEGYIPISPF